MTYYELRIVYPTNEEEMCPTCFHSTVETHPFMAGNDYNAVKMAEEKVGPLEYAFKSACLAWHLDRVELTDEPGKANYTRVTEREGTWYI
jgi:hypothetical protein